MLHDAGLGLHAMHTSLQGQQASSRALTVGVVCKQHCCKHDSPSSR